MTSLLALHAILCFLLLPLAACFVPLEPWDVPIEAIYLMMRSPVESGTLLFAFGILSVAQVVVYVVLLRAVARQRTQPFGLLGRILTFAPLLVAAATPALTSDIYYYAGIGRLQAQFGRNPYLHPIASEPMEPANQIDYWELKHPTMYGPALVAGLAAVSWVSGSSFALNVLAYKLLALCAFLASAHVIRLLFDLLRAGSGKIISLAFVLNPFAIRELLVDGHNDVFLLLIVLLTLLLALKERFTASFFCLFLIGLLKFPLLFMGPLLLAYAWTRRRRRIIYDLLPAGAVAAPVLLALYLMYFQDPDAFKAFGLLSRYMGATTPTVSGIALMKLFDLSPGTIAKTISVFRAAFLVYLLYTAFQVRDAHSLVAATGRVIFMFLLVFNSYHWPNYWVLVLPFAFLSFGQGYFLPAVGAALGSILFEMFMIGYQTESVIANFVSLYALFFAPVIVLLIASKRKSVARWVSTMFDQPGTKAA